MKNVKRRTSPKAQPAAPESPAAPGGLKVWHVLVGLLIAAFFLAEVYQPAIRGPFLFDDNYLPFAQPDYKDFPLRDWLIGARPTLMFSYWLNYQASGSDPFTYHVANVFLHLLNGLLIFFAVRRILSRVSEVAWARELMAAFSGAVFLLHPLQTEAVAYVASRSENLSIFLFLASFNVFLYRRAQAISFLEALAAGILFGGAVTTKEHTVVLPALLLLTDYYWNPGFSFQGIKRNWRLYLPVVVIGAMALSFLWRILGESDTAGFRLEGLPWYLYLATQGKVIWIYLRMFLLPFGQNVDHNYPMVTSLADPFAIIGLAALLAAVVLAWLWRRRYPLASYGTLVFLLLLAPTSSVVPIRDALVERRLYLPMIGLLFILSDLLLRWRAGRRAIAATLAGVAVVAGLLAFNRAQAWAGPVELWTDAVTKAPDNPRAQFQLAFAYFAEQRCSEAVDQFAKVAELQEPDYRLLVDWGLAYDCASRPAEALAKLQQAAALEQTAHVYALIGMMQAKQGWNDVALESLATAEQTNPRFAVTYFNRGNIFVSTGKDREAIAEYEKAIARDPDLAAAARAAQSARQRLAGQAR